ncbi:MAG: ribose 5-phosphate isomerase B [bacterium]|jgi:ribose 5-phosphate isomerase B
MRIAIGSDHAGYELKERVKELLTDLDLDFTDYGTNSLDSVDYPDIGSKVAEAVANNEYDRGILACGTGIGMSITANKVPGVRAALCYDLFSTRLSREHNDANVLVLGARVLGYGLALEIVHTWLLTDFVGGRHSRRIGKIADLDKKYRQ